MISSPSIQNLAAALVAAQSEMPIVEFDSTNPFLKNRYATLGAVIRTSRPILAKHNLAIVQSPISAEGTSDTSGPEPRFDKDPEPPVVSRKRTGANDIGIETLLVHSSGEYLGERLFVPITKEKGKSTAQMAGSIISYLRRYAWAAVLGIYADEDTDGNEPQNAPGQFRGVSTAPKATPRAPKPTAPAAPAQNKPTPTTGATKETLAWMLEQLNARPGEPAEGIVTEYFRAVAGILPTESLADLPLEFVPTTVEQLEALSRAIGDFENGDQALLPYKVAEVAAPQAPTKSAPKPPPTAKPPPPPSVAAAQASDDEWFLKFIVPVPRKGMKRDEYMRNPDTIGSLFEGRHNKDEESREGTRRLFGFVNSYEAKGWQKRDGTQMPPSDTDIQFREALDAFADWFEKNHPGEKL